MKGFLITCAAVPLILAACGGHGTTCTAQTGAPALVYPPSNSTGVSPTIGTLYFANSAAGTTITLMPTSGSTINATPPHAPPSPLPAGVPTPGPGQVYSVSDLPALQSSMTYTVKATVPEPCGNLKLTFNVGQFTTQ